jgi:hypothetical protein
VANLLIHDSRQIRVAGTSVPAFSSKAVFGNKQCDVRAYEFSPVVQGTNPMEVMPGQRYSV